MKSKLLLLALILFLALSGCANKKESSWIEEDQSPRSKKGGSLAYEHTVTIETDETQLEKQYRSVLAACNEAEGFKCIVLDSEIDTGYHPDARITLRVEAAGLPSIMKAATRHGKVTKKNTHAEDLAEPIADAEKRLSMLRTQRDLLLKLQKRPDNDIDSLLKIASELSRVQSEIEHATGERAHLQKRIDLDLLELYFRVDSRNAFWRPFMYELRNFKGHLAEGASNTIRAVAYLLPWFLALVPTLIFLRFIWRKTSKK